MSAIGTGSTTATDPQAENMQAFHAGWRKSGIGGADGKHGLYENTRTHMVYIQYDTAAGNKK